ncbi:response regulator transcription factor [Paractinoplanes lichenicola]|uniref:Response regulator transcription factor n=1 Tax=Paractinoplanes lichenicola TaxID=2802976 RepID=A0ABS1VUG5_9ACTN|nr:response regulator transcription factor [Actinoplanes lichenicola]MBL7258131.1 response regulator transcription factor [Actinoplanes lichenicola]
MPGYEGSLKLAAPATIRVVVADDEPLIRAGLTALLSAGAGLDVVAEARSGRDAVGAAAGLDPDVLILGLPAEGDANDLIAEVAASGRARVLALAAGYAAPTVWAALRAGAAGFLLKSRPPEVLLAAVRAVALAGVWLDDVFVNDMLGEMAVRPGDRATSSVLVRRLTPREREVLVLLANGLGNGEIAERLFLSDGTVRTHIGHILMKLECRDRTRAVVIAYRTGLVGLLPSGAAHR